MTKLRPGQGWNLQGKNNQLQSVLNKTNKTTVYGITKGCITNLWSLDIQQLKNAPLGWYRQLYVEEIAKREKIQNQKQGIGPGMPQGVTEKNKTHCRQRKKERKKSSVAQMTHAILENFYSNNKGNLYFYSCLLSKNSKNNESKLLRKSVLVQKKPVLDFW